MPVSAEMKRRLIRLGFLGAALIALFAAGKLTGVTDRMTVDGVRGFVLDAGPWGYALFVGAFSVGQLIYVPGMAFVAAGILAYGQLLGFAVGWVAALVSVNFSFLLVRTVGGKALAEIERPFMKKMLAKLEQRPLLTVIGLRALFAMNPALNYGLALSTLKFRDHLLGSAIGLIPQLALAALFFDWFFSRIVSAK